MSSIAIGKWVDRNHSVLKSNGYFIVRIHFLIDPVIAIIVYFVCGPIAYIMKYTNLNSYVDYFGDRFSDMETPTAGQVIGVWAGVFISVIFAIAFPPLFLASIGLMIYSVILEKRWQDSLNFQINKAMAQAN